MECFFCKGDMVDGLTTNTTDLGDTILIVKQVPCLKCNQCGEVAYTGEVIQRLENIIGEYKNSQTEIAVVKYPKVA